MRFLTLGVICLGAVIPLGAAAEEKVEAAQGQAEEKWDGFKELQGDMEKLIAEGQFEEAAERCDVYLAKKGLDSEQKQAVLYLKYFAQSMGSDFAKASETAQALQDEGPETELAKLAIGLKQQADADLAAKEKSEAAKPKGEAPDETARPQKVTPAQGAKMSKATKPKKEKVAELPKKEAPKEEGEKNELPKKRAQRTDPGAESKPKKAPNHQESLRALDASHKALAKAEEAFAKAKADLTSAQAAHDEAHQNETAAREFAKEGSKQEEKDDASIGKPSPQEEGAEEEAKATPEIDAFEKRSAELRERAANLRKKAEELREGEVE